MSVASALKAGDPAQLPSKRDEDWRWTDLRGLLRVLPPPTGPVDLAELPRGAFDGLASETHILAGGREAVEIVVPAQDEATVWVSTLTRGATPASAKAASTWERKRRPCPSRTRGVFLRSWAVISGSAANG